ncbi:MAG TPA: hypothetical protein ENG00_00165 [Candidatus Aenigmarchaeota archaeon]|nr:hypothetical protein [Candidatus Aenigmarchaeota archaeon]
MDKVMPMQTQKSSIDEIIREILENRGVPRNIKAMLEESMSMMDMLESENEKISCIISVLDEASSDPNLSPFARTQIWSVVSRLESMKK